MTTTVRPAESLLGRGGDLTATEIAQQPDVWRRVPQCIDDDVRRDLHALLERPDVRVVLTGAGTSAYAGQVIAPRLRRLLQRRIDAVPTTDIVAAPRDTFTAGDPTLLVSFARSGDSPESVAATRLADQLLDDVHHLVLTTNPDGRLATEFADRDDATVVLLPAEADDAGFAMTSSFTSMTLAALLALGESVDVEALATSVEAVLSTWVERAATLTGHSRIVYLGSGALHGLAQESALKVLELTAGRLVALSESSLGFRHGPKSFLDDDTLAVVYVSIDEYTRAYDLDILRELRGALPDGQVLAVSASGDGLDDTALLLPGLADAGDTTFAIGAVVAAQLIALQNSLHAGVTPDNPFPDQQVNRVVQGVTIHPFGA